MPAGLILMIIDVAADGLAVYSRLFSEPAF